MITIVATMRMWTRNPQVKHLDVMSRKRMMDDMMMLEEHVVLLDLTNFRPV
jgi:hypothetical protein